MPMYNLIEYSDNYSKASGIKWQYCRVEPVVANYGNITDSNENNVNTNSFQTNKQKK